MDEIDATAPQPAVSYWEGLQKRLDGSFTARARGFLGNEFVLLDPDGREFGRLGMRGPSGASSGAKLAAGDAEVEIERSRQRSGLRYRMVSGDAEVLAAVTHRFAAGPLDISGAGETYKARVNLLRNTAVARPSGGQEDPAVVTLRGGFTGRGYEVLLGDVPGQGLLVAILLLYHLVALRKTAFLV